MKKIIWILVIATLVGGVWYHKFASDAGSDPRAKTSGGMVMPVTVGVIKQEELFDNVEALGTAYANESIDITANTTETIAEISFEDGQEIKRGDIIALLDQKQEEAQLKASEIRLSEHIREFSRLENLLKKKAASTREYEERKTLLEVTRQETREIVARMEERTLRAPFDGVLGLRRLSVGALVRPGDIITTLDDISKIKLDFNVPDIYLSSLKRGMEIQARSVSFGDEIFKAVISTIDTRIDPVTRSVLVRAIIDNDDKRIIPGVLMQVTLLKDKRLALVAAEEAVFQKQDRHYVMLVEKSADAEKPSKVSEREVKIGVRSFGVVEITDGLNIGDVIVTRGIHMIRAGQEVSIKNTEIFNAVGVEVKGQKELEVEIIENVTPKLIMPDSADAKVMPVEKTENPKEENDNVEVK